MPRAGRWPVALLVATLVFTASTIPVSSATPSFGDLSEDQYATVRERIWAADTDFGGYGVDFATHNLILHPVEGKSGATALLNYVGTVAATNDGNPKLWSVQVVAVRYSLAELRTVQGRVVAQKMWSSYLTMVHVDTATNTVYLGFSTVTSDVANEARSLFGEEVELAIATAGAGATRQSDSAPWWGGDNIHGNAGYCTGGFPVIRRSNGHRGMLTAGHCFAVNDTVYQSSYTMGTVTWRSYADWQVDLEFFDATPSVQGAIYTGCQTCNLPYYYVNGVGLASVGAIACSDGYVSAPADCTVGINWIDGCLNVTTNGTTVFTCGLAEGIASDGRIITQAGDSGGPMYRTISGGYVQTYGSIVGNTKPPVNGHIQPSTDVIFTEWQATIGTTFRAICYTQSNCN